MTMPVLRHKITTTDLENGKTVIMDHGDLPLVMRASMSVSGVFPAKMRIAATHVKDSF